MKNNQIMTVEYPKTVQSAVENVINAWKKFCANDSEVKSTFPKSKVGGYQVETSSNGTLDAKEAFHYTQGGHKQLFSSAQKVGLDAVRMVEKNSVLIEMITQIVATYAEFIEQEYSIKGFKNEVLASRDSWILRTIRYFENQAVGQEIASSHPDKSGFTLHLYESESGLEYCVDHTNMQWSAMPLKQDNTVIIPGMQLQGATKGKLKALWHRVVATKKSAKTSRYSMVCFIPLLNHPKWNKTEKGRLQDYQAGYFSEMQDKEFQTYMI